jgi:antitoxin component YwqK of YwqJK toxin-antitoxin module
MRKLIAIGILLVFALGANAQQANVKVENGKYYSVQGSLFTGTYAQYEGSNKIAELSIDNGVLNGAALYFHTNGRLKEEGKYVNGQRSGKWTQYNELGKVTTVANFVNDAKHGSWLVWDDNGNKRFEMNYNNGKRIGIWKMWDEEGNLTTKDFGN